MKTDRELLKEANEILRSCNSVIERKGAQTNWDALEKRVKQVLNEQRKVLYPTDQFIQQQMISKIDLVDKKIKVVNPENSKRIQELALSLGFTWTDGKRGVQYTDAKYLFFEGSKQFLDIEGRISCSDREEVWDAQYQKEITLQELGFCISPI